MENMRSLPILKHLPDVAGMVCISIFLFLALTIGTLLIRDGDTFWHIHAGKIILETGSLIKYDIFSSTAYGKPWVSHEWLSEIIMAGLEGYAGLEGLLSFFILIVSLTFCLLFQVTAKSANESLAAISVILSFILTWSHLMARPHIFTWLFTVLTMLIIAEGGKRLYWLPVIMMLWANLHGGFIVGILLQTLFIFGSAIEIMSVQNGRLQVLKNELKTPVIILIVSLITVCINPFGIELLMFPFTVSRGSFSVLIKEWMAPDLQNAWYLRYYLIFLIFIISIVKNRINWTERLLLVFFLNAALTHLRHFSLMIIVLTPMFAKALDEFLAFLRDKTNNVSNLHLSRLSGPIICVTLTVILLLFGASDRRNLSFMRPQILMGKPFNDLEELTNYLSFQRPKGKLFNEYALGGYLLYALDEPPRVFIDGRADMYGEKIFLDYKKIQNSSDREYLLNEYEVDWVVFERDSSLVHDLLGSELWQPSFINDSYAVLVRK